MKCNQNGFTIIELLIALAIAAIITGAAMSLYITENKQLMVQNSVSDTQSSLRAASSELASQIRLAGYNIPDVAMAIKASNTNPDSITIGINSGMPCGPVTLSAAMPQPSAELKVAGDISCINDGDTLYIYDPTTKFGENFICTNVQRAAMHLQHNTTDLHESYQSGSLILKQFHTIKYYIDRSTASHPNFMKSIDGGAASVYAENITNLNLRYVLSSGAIVDVPAMNNMVREVIISVDARTDASDNEFQTSYRTRSVTTKVKVRNLAIR